LMPNLFPRRTKLIPWPLHVLKAQALGASQTLLIVMSGPPNSPQGSHSSHSLKPIEIAVALLTDHRVSSPKLSPIYSDITLAVPQMAIEKYRQVNNDDRDPSRVLGLGCNMHGELNWNMSLAG